MPRTQKPARLIQLKKGGNYFIAFNDGKRDRRMSVGSRDRQIAEEVLVKFIATQSTQKGKKADPALLSLDRCLAYYLHHHASKLPSADQAVIAAVHLTDILGNVMVGDLGAELTNKYTAARESAGIKIGTVHRELSVLSAALNFAVEQELISYCPRIKLPAKAASSAQSLDPEQVAKLFDAIPKWSPHLRTFIMIALHTGARSGAVLDLTWDRVDFKLRRINFQVPGMVETNKRRAKVPINDQLFDYLRSLDQDPRTPFVVNWNGAQVVSVKRAFRALVKRANLKNISPHSLRHTAASWMAQAGVPMVEIAEMLAQSVARTTQVYIHLSPQHLVGAAASIGNIAPSPKLPEPSKKKLRRTTIS